MDGTFWWANNLSMYPATIATQPSTSAVQKTDTSQTEAMLHCWGVKAGIQSIPLMVKDVGG